MEVVRAASKRKVVEGRWTAVNERDDVMDLDEAPFGATALCTDERAPPSVAGPQLAFHRCRDVARAR
jgi:hypothetical protein